MSKQIPESFIVCNDLSFLYCKGLTINFEGRDYKNLGRITKFYRQFYGGSIGARQISPIFLDPLPKLMSPPKTLNFRAKPLGVFGRGGELYNVKKYRRIELIPIRTLTQNLSMGHTQMSLFCKGSFRAL